MTQLDRYIVIAAVRAIMMVAFGLAALFSLLAFVDQLNSVGQGHYHLIDAIAYVALTAPARLVQVMPVSMLLGSLLALGALGRSGELTAMRSFGMSEARIILAVLKLAVPIIAALFLIAQFVVPPAQQRAQSLRTTALYSSTLHRDDNSFWAHKDNQFLSVRQFNDGNNPSDIDTVTFAPDGLLTSFIHADHATIGAHDTWHLHNVVLKTIIDRQFETQRSPHLDWHAFMSRHQIELLMLAPETMPPIALFHYVRQLEHRHVPAIRYAQQLWSRAAIPLSIIAMVLIAAPFVFGLPRTQSAGQQLMIGALFGITFTLIQQIASRLDLLLDLNPALTALTPPILLMALAGLLLRRAWR